MVIQRHRLDAQRIAQLARAERLEAFLIDQA
jgi:hypothetical protein